MDFPVICLFFSRCFISAMKSVKDRFMKAPYGFVEDDVFWLVARLFKRGDLTFTVNGASVSLNNKTEEEIIGFITKKAFVEKLLMEEDVYKRQDL